MAKSDLAGYGEEYYDQRYRLSGTGFDIPGSGLYSQATPGPSGYIVGYDTAFGDARYALSGSGGGGGPALQAGSGLIKVDNDLHVQVGSGLYLLPDEVGVDIDSLDNRYVQQDSEEAESMYVFGAASEAISTTTSTTYVQKLKNTFTARHDGIHRVDWYMEVANTGAAGVAARIQLDDTTTLGQVGPLFPGASIPFPWGGMAWVNLTSGVSYDLDLDYRSTGGTAVTRFARISCEHITVF